MNAQNECNIRLKRFLFIGNWSSGVINIAPVDSKVKQLGRGVLANYKQGPLSLIPLKTVIPGHGWGAGLAGSC